MPVGSIPGGDNSGDEDCLFLNVYSPENATNLPILVWIRKSIHLFLRTLNLVFSASSCVWKFTVAENMCAEGTLD